MDYVWVVWAVNLLAQNFMFTIVSRARNSGSLRRHVVAAVGSNGVWILQMQILMGPMLEYLQGRHGLSMQILVGAFYTIFTVAGSVLAHYWALGTEKGKSVVGANVRYAQITREEWDEIKKFVASSSGGQKMSGLEPKTNSGTPPEAKTACFSMSAQFDVLERATRANLRAWTRICSRFGGNHADQVFFD